jgi:hypothetical protein
MWNCLGERASCWSRRKAQASTTLRGGHPRDETCQASGHCGTCGSNPSRGSDLHFFTFYQIISRTSAGCRAPTSCAAKHHQGGQGSSSRAPHPAKKPAGATSDPNVECVSLHNFMKSQGAETAKGAATTKKAARKRGVNQGVIGFKPQKAKATADGSPAKSTRSKASSKGKAPKKKGAKS